MLTSDFDSQYAFFLEIVVFIVSSLGSGLFLYMIMKKTEPIMRVYRIILLYSCLFDWIITFTSFFTRPVFFIDSGNVYMLANYFIQLLPSHLQYMSNYTYMFAFHSLPAVVACTYYYRYMVVCKEKIMSTGKFLGVALVANLGAFIMVALNSLWMIPYYGQHAQVFREHISGLTNTFLVENRDKIFGIGLSGHPAGVHVYIVGFVYTFTSYTVIAIYIRKVVNSFHIRNGKTRWHSVNKQIAKSLIVQAITPSVTLVPMFLLMATCFLLKPSERFVTGCNYVLNITLTLMPVINPFVAASFIDSYRQSGLTLVSCVLCCGRPVRSATKVVREKEVSTLDKPSKA